MKRPICNNEMKEGVLLSGRPITWVPLETFNKKFRFFNTGSRLLSNHNYLKHESNVSNAYLCENCNKVIGMFDIVKKL